MSSINYLEIIKKSWSITWHNKYLWWFGFFIALSGTGSFANYSPDQKNNPGSFSQQISAFGADHAGLLITGLVVILLFCLILLVMHVLSGALIESIEKNSKGEPSGFKAGIKEGKKYFWKLLFISLLIGLSVAAIAMVIATPIAFLFMTGSYVSGALLTLIAIIILIPLFVLAYFLRTFGFIYAVLGNLSTTNAIESAYNLFLRNVWSSFIMALIFIPIGLMICFGFLLIFIFLAITFLVVGLILFFLFNQIGAMIAIFTGLFCAFLIFLLIRSVYETFAQAVWIFFFHEVAKPKVTESVREAVAEEKPAPATNPNPVIFLDK